jgi:hypothetical protein
MPPAFNEFPPDTKLAELPAPVLAARLVQLGGDYKTISDGFAVLHAHIQLAHDQLKAGRVEAARATLEGLIAAAPAVAGHG